MKASSVISGLSSTIGPPPVLPMAAGIGPGLRWFCHWWNVSEQWERGCSGILVIQNLFAKSPEQLSPFPYQMPMQKTITKSRPPNLRNSFDRLKLHAIGHRPPSWLGKHSSFPEHNSRTWRSWPARPEQLSKTCRFRFSRSESGLVLRCTVWRKTHRRNGRCWPWPMCCSVTQEVLCRQK